MSVLALASIITLTQDVGRVADFLAGKGKAFASVELLGWTSTNALVYRTSVCDDNDMGARGAYCTVDVCTLAAGEKPDCESVIDDEPRTRLGRKAAIAAVKHAQDERHVAKAGTRT